MAKLNYHHLYYFWQVAKEGNLTKAANQMHVSQSALSMQIKQLEHAMDVNLFERDGRKLRLTESGQRTFLYADEIFKKGEELESFLRSGAELHEERINIGVLSTMSRNFIDTFVEPLLADHASRFSLHARGQAKLLSDLTNHELDLALTNIEVTGSNERLWQCQLLARQPVAVVGPPDLVTSKRFSRQYKDQHWVLPVAESPLRSGFDSFCAQHGFTPRIAAEANDMAMLRLLARDIRALTILPSVVVKDELASGKLVQLMKVPNLFENFYAVTVRRQFPSPMVRELLEPWLKNQKH